MRPVLLLLVSGVFDGVGDRLVDREQHVLTVGIRPTQVAQPVPEVGAGLGDRAGMGRYRDRAGRVTPAHVDALLATPGPPLQGPEALGVAAQVFPTRPMSNRRPQRRQGVGSALQALVANYAEDKTMVDESGAHRHRRGHCRMSRRTSSGASMTTTAPP